MDEHYHYKGGFSFVYHPTNQTKIVKRYLKKIFPSEAIKKAKEVKKNIAEYDIEAFLEKNKKSLVDPIRYFKTELLKEDLEEKFKVHPNEVALFYLLMDDIMGTITFKDSFNIEDELAQNVLIEALNKNNL